MKIAECLFTKQYNQNGKFVSETEHLAYGLRGHWLNKTVSKIWCQCFDDTAAIIRLSAGHNIYMMTSSNGNISRITGPLCGEFTGHRWFPGKKASDAELWCSLYKWLSKQSWGWWIETPSRSLWRHCNILWDKPFLILKILPHRRNNRQN